MLFFRCWKNGSFEFEDTEGAGEGTYGIVELAAVLIVRDYDGPDDKFTVQTPVVVEFSDALFSTVANLPDICLIRCWAWVIPAGLKPLAGVVPPVVL